MSSEYVSEEDIRVLVEETIDYTIEDQGIGHYEYGDGNYIDKNQQISLTDGEIMVQYTDDVEQVIFTRVIGTITGYDTDDIDSDNAFTYNVTTEDSFYSQVIHKTNGGQLPFIFQPDVNDNTNFAIAKIDSGFKFKQVANGIYSIKLKIRD